METNHEKQLVRICAAWELWAAYSEQVRSIAVANSLTGDYASSEQHKRATQLLYAQHAEAFARARLQATIVDSLDEADTVDEYTEHWRAIWGEALTEQLLGEYDTAFARAVQGITERRKAAREQSAALLGAGVS